MSYFEGVQGLQNFFWDIDIFNEELHGILKRAFGEVCDARDKYDTDMKKAAFIVALGKLFMAMRLRGLFPA